MAQDLDMITGRPRTPNEPYSIITDEQIRNIRHDALTFVKKIAQNQCVGFLRKLIKGDKSGNFFFSRTPTKQTDLHGGEPREGGRYYRDRYGHLTSMSLLNDPKTYGNQCWVGDQLRTDLPVKYDTCRGMASAKWGPQKTGEATRSHFFGENVDRYTTIDMYRRPVTNYTGRVVMDCGRPADGYYTQRFPNRSSWFRSTAKLNCTNVLQSVHRKTEAEYKQIQESERMARLARNDNWPDYSEYTDKFVLRTRTPATHKSNIERVHEIIREREKIRALEDKEREEELRGSDKDRNLYTAMARAACRPIVVAM